MSLVNDHWDAKVWDEKLKRDYRVCDACKQLKKLECFDGEDKVCRDCFELLYASIFK